MEGHVTWPQAIWIITVIGGAVSAGFLAAWYLQILRSRDIKLCEDKILALETNIEARLSAIELFNAGTVVTLGHIKDFREEVQAQYERLRAERKQDMQALHTRLDTIFNTVQMVKLREKNG